MWGAADGACCVPAARLLCAFCAAAALLVPACCEPAVSTRVCYAPAARLRRACCEGVECDGSGLGSWGVRNVNQIGESKVACNFVLLMNVMAVELWVGV